MAQWFYKKQGKQRGPFTPSQLRRLAGNGEIGPDSPVRKRADGQWRRAASIKNLLPSGSLNTSEPSRTKLEDPQCCGSWDNADWKPREVEIREKSPGFGCFVALLLTFVLLSLSIAIAESLGGGPAVNIVFFAVSVVFLIVSLKTAGSKQTTVRNEVTGWKLTIGSHWFGIRCFRRDFGLSPASHITIKERKDDNGTIWFGPFIVELIGSQKEFPLKNACVDPQEAEQNMRDVAELLGIPCNAGRIDERKHILKSDTLAAREFTAVRLELKTVDRKQHLIVTTINSEVPSQELIYACDEYDSILAAHRSVEYRLILQSLELQPRIHLRKASGMDTIYFGTDDEVEDAVTFLEEHVDRTIEWLD